MSPSNWGPPTWDLMHTLAEKVKEDKYQAIFNQLYGYITQICYNLPCPECAMHARQFLSKVKSQELKQKQNLIDLLFVFHNLVNKRKIKPMYKYEELQKYKSKNIITSFNNFSVNFSSNGNVRLLADNFHRGQLISSLKKWIMQNIQNFDL
jgi:hypothetical protein